MTFKLPILDVLDRIEDETHGTLLNRVIYFLYIEENQSAKITAALLSISEPTVLIRIPKKEKKRARLERKYKAVASVVSEMYKTSSNPKEIAFDLKIPLGKVYEILKEEKQDDNKT